MEKEIWKDIPGYEGLYQPSNYGRIRSLDREVRHNYGGIAVKKGKILTPSLQRNGYLTYTLTKKIIVKVPRKVIGLYGVLSMDQSRKVCK